MLKAIMLRIVLTAFAWSISVTAYAHADQKQIEVPGGDLIVALDALAKQTGAEIVYHPELIKGLRTAGAFGTMSPQDAVTKLLMGTQLVLRTDSTGAMLISAPELSGGSALDNKDVPGRIRLAQTNQVPAPGPSSTTSDASSKLEEIVVTATRREESLEKVPISIGALSQEQLTEGGIKSIADLAAVTPGLQFTANPGGYVSTISEISIRGLNSNTGASTVGLYIDDTPIQGRFSSVANVGNVYPIVFDLDRVEVERGPQGTLFGAGSEAGTIRFITNQPSTTEFTGFSHSEVATTQDGAPSYEVGAAAGGPIVQDSLGFRVSAWTRTDGGYVDLMDPITEAIVRRNSNKDDKSAFRAALTFVGDGIRVTPSIYYQSVHVDNSGQFYGLYSDSSQGLYINAPLMPEISTDNMWLSSIKLEAALPFADLTSVTSYMHRVVDVNLDYSAFFGTLLGPNGYGSPLAAEIPTSPADVAPTGTGQRLGVVTEELRLASNQPSAFVTWIAGVFYNHQTQQDYQVSSSLQFDPTGAPIYNLNQHATDDQIATFAQGDFHLTKQLTLTLGERVARVTSDLSVAFAPGVFDTGIPPLTYATLTQTPSTPRIALSYQPTPNNLFYLSASKGFRIGGGNAPVAEFCNVQNLPNVKSDYVWSYEVGAKSTLFDGRAQVDLSAFHIDWRDIQQQVYLPCGEQYTANAGNAVSNGFDLSLQILATERLRLNLNVGYANAYFTSNVYDSAGAPQVLSGDKVGYLPEVNAPWNVNGLATYKIPLSADEALRFRGEYQYQSRNPGPFISQIPTSMSYLPALEPNPAIQVINSRVGYSRKQFDLSLFVNNVFNSHPLLNKSVFVVDDRLSTYSTLRPRTVGLSANYAF